MAPDLGRIELREAAAAQNEQRELKSHEGLEDAAVAVERHVQASEPVARDQARARAAHKHVRAESLRRRCKHRQH